jgi:hypothetical protein
MVIRKEKLEQNALQSAPTFLAFSEQVFVTWSFQLFCDIIIYTQTHRHSLIDAKIDARHVVPTLPWPTPARPTLPWPNLSA